MNNYGSAGTAPDLLFWSAGALPKRRMILHVVRDFVFLPGLAPIWDSGWVGFLLSAVDAEDVCSWPYFVGILVKLVAFSGSLPWPTAGADLGGRRVKHVELLISFERGSLLSKALFCMSFGLVRGSSMKKLSHGIVDLDAQFQCRLFLLVQTLIFGVLVDSLRDL